jgi:hypothetical protein
MLAYLADSEDVNAFFRGEQLFDCAAALMETGTMEDAAGSTTPRQQVRTTNYVYTYYIYRLLR